MNVRTIDEFKSDIEDSPINIEQAGRDFEATIRLRQDVESYFDLRRQMSQDDAEFAQKNISSLGVGEIISRYDRQHYVELLYDANLPELLSYVDDGATHVAKSLGWSEDEIMDEFIKYDREQALKEITPQLKADSSFLQNTVFRREGYDGFIQPEELPYYMKQEYDKYEYRETDKSACVPKSEPVESSNNNFFEAKSTELPLPDDAYKVKSDFRNRMYNTAFDDYGFDEKFDDDDLDY